VTLSGVAAALRGADADGHEFLGYTNSKPTSRRAMFHINKDSTTIDNIAVSSGSGSCEHRLIACGIGPSLSGLHVPSAALNILAAQTVPSGRTTENLPCFPRRERTVKFSGIRGPRDRGGTVTLRPLSDCQLMCRSQ
jgi:hypothetical protein